MARYVASYDLDTGHNEFITQARKRPWDVWVLSSQNTWFRLPNTTLVGEFPTLAAAETALLETREATQRELGKAVTLQKWIIAEYSSSRFNSNETQAKT